METNPSAILQTTGRSTSELLVMEQVKAVALDPPLMGDIYVQLPGFITLATLLTSSTTNLTTGGLWCT